MKKIAFLALLGLPLFLSAAPAAPTAVKPAWRDDFTNTEKVDGVVLPKNWAYGGSKIGVPMTGFYVQEDPELKKPVLVVDANHSTGALMCRPSDQKVDLKKTPILRWRWRVMSLPPEGDGRGKIDDQPIAIYIGANDWFTKRSVAYRWENLTPINTTGHIKYGGGIMKVNWICLRNKDSKLNTWHEEKRDVAADFKKIYGDIPDEFVLSVCANSQYSKSHTKAEIEFLEFLPAEPVKKVK